MGSASRLAVNSQRAVGQFAQHEQQQAQHMLQQQQQQEQLEKQS